MASKLPILLFVAPWRLLSGDIVVPTLVEEATPCLGGNLNGFYGPIEKKSFTICSGNCFFNACCGIILLAFL
jgi:hypothetical protein